MVKRDTYIDQLVGAAAELSERRLSVIPADGKKPLGGHDWHKRRYVPDEMRKLLDGCTDPAIGLCFEQGSCIDVEADGPQDEALIGKLFEGVDEPNTPTYSSQRGLHRLFRFDDRLEATDRAFIFYPRKDIANLEIRIGAGGKAAQSIIPPSAGRHWLSGRSINDLEFAALPDLVVDRIVAAAMEPTQTTTRPIEHLEYQENEARHREYVMKTIDHYKISQDTAVPSIGTQQDTAVPPIALCPHTVEEAIEATVPSGPGFRHRQIFVFARYLKGMPEYFGNTAEQLEPIVRRWHQHALPFISTKSFNETWRDFEGAWKNVKFPIRSGPLAQIASEAKSKPLPKAAGGYDRPDLQNLVALCCELQRARGDRPFFLTCRDAARILGGSATQKSRWSKHLNQLCADGVLRLNSRGCRGRASEFFYLGGQV